MEVALSFVIPMYNAASTIEPVIREIEALDIPGGHEIVLVDDCGGDDTVEVCRRLVPTVRVPITVIAHARNFGEHNAVLTGWRHARGRHVVNLDDDGQNPPREAAKLWRHAVSSGMDVVYGHYEVKRHSAFRNFGSWFTNRITDVALDKPRGFYLSSFRCVSGFIARQVVAYGGPYPYIDGLLLQVTQRIDSIVVSHEERHAGQSGYTLRRLIRLWLSAWLNFSLLPLRVATLAGFTLASVGLLAFLFVLWLWFTGRGPEYGFGWLMSGMLIFSGVQLVMLGLIGEYLGRMFLTINQRPQSVVREVIRSGESSHVSSDQDAGKLRTAGHR